MTNQPFTFPVDGTAPNQSAEVTAFSTALNRALGFATASKQARPGKFPDQYTSVLTGRGNGAGIAGEVVASSIYGDVWEVTGSGIVALRDRVAVEEGVVLFARYLRSQNPTDPAGDSVVFRIRWLNATFGTISTTTVQTDTLTVASGLQEVVATINVPNATTTPPSGAVYAVPYVETFGTNGKTQVINLGARAVDELDADNLTYEPGFTFPQDVIPEFPVARTFYVTMDGNNSNSGTSLSSPLATITAAIAKMVAVQSAAGSQVSCVVIVHPGDYLVPRDTEIPPNCALYGYDLRVTMLRLANAAGTGPATSNADRQQNMFLMRSGIKVRGFSLTGMRHESYTFTPESQTGTPPQKGYGFAFKPGEIIIRSPYIADCTVIHDLTQDQMALPIDRATGNPLLPRGCGNLYADGSVLSGYSPLRSVVVDSYTSVNPNGVGYAVVRNALVQLVSVFTNWSRVGVWAHEGGQVTLANSNNTFGDYAFVASDSRQSILIPDGSVVGLGVFDSAATTLTNQTEAIITALMGSGTNSFATRITGWSSFTSTQQALTEGDTRRLLKELIGDLRAGQERGAQRFVKGLFDWDAKYIWNTASVSVAQFNQGFDAIRDEIATHISGGSLTMITNLIGLVKDVLDDPDPYRVPFVSVIEFAGQAFSYSGSGANYNALPFAQRGTAILPDPTSTIVQWGGGRCYGTFSTERGDTYLGNDLRVDFERSTVEGQAFSRGVQNIALPLIIALG